MAEYIPVTIISDNPADPEAVFFGFDGYSKTLSEIIASKDNTTPLVIGIHGPWGSGKTTLMKAVKKNLEKLNPQEFQGFRTCKTVWFQAWKYAKEDEILAALIEEIIRAMKQDGFFEGCKAKIEELISQFNLKKLFGKATEKIIGLDVAQFFDELPHKSRLGYYESFQMFFDRLIWTYLNWKPQICESETTDDREAALVVFIDDLDRCPRERIPQVLETVKLFMDKKGCIFVIGAAGEIIEDALKPKYGEEGAGKFMDKIVQVTFNLPQARREDFERYLERIGFGNSEEVRQHLPLLIKAVRSNVRRLKRFLNNLSLLLGALRNRDLEIAYKNVFFWNLIDYLYPALGKDLKDRPRNLEELRAHIGKLAPERGETDDIGFSKDDLEKAKIPASFHKYLQDRDLVQILKVFEITTPELEQLISLSGIGHSTEDLKEKKEQSKDIGVDLDAWAEVPAGEFTYQYGRERIETPYFIDIYPVTNSQFEKFVKAGGYQNQACWTEEGWKWLQENRVSEPKFWFDSKWNQPEHPVVGVSFFEAEAYASWAGKRLPTEKEWERAARGTDGRQYPWGDTFDQERCNTSESGIGGTTRVTRYPNGVSPIGCYDMAGNIWEWTSDWHDQFKSAKVLRGGSWFLDRGYAGCSFRDRDHPDNRNDDVGFRCVRTKK
jgi:DNA polymerase III delta prime subunit